MKILKNLVTGVVLIIIMLVSFGIKAQNKYVKEIDFEKIGQEHNSGLEFVYDYLVQNFKNQNTTDLIQTSTLEYLKKSDYTISYVEQVKKGFQEDESLFSEDGIEDLKNQVVKNFENSNSNKYLTNFQDIINNFTKNQNIKIQDVIRDLRKIELNVSNDDKLSEKDYISLRSLLVTCIYSLDYWNSNYSKWSETNNDETTQARGWSWFKEAISNMATADAYGAGVGAVVGFVSSVVSGPGVVVGTAAGAIGYGMNASALAGVRELF